MSFKRYLLTIPTAALIALLARTASAEDRDDLRLENFMDDDETVEKVEKEEESKKSKKTKKSDLDFDTGWFYKINNSTDINLWSCISTGGNWQGHHQALDLYNIQSKLLAKIGEENEGRLTLDFRNLYQVMRADIQNQEDRNCYGDLSKLVGGFGWHIGNKNLLAYIEAKAGYEWLNYDGSIDLYAGDVLLGAKVSFASEPTNTLAAASLMGSPCELLGIKGVDRYKGSMGVDKIPVEGDYSNLVGTAYVLQGITDNVFALLNGSANYAHFENLAKLNTYVVSGGLEARTKLMERNLAGSLEFVAKKKISDSVGVSADEHNAYGALLKMKLDLGRGFYLTGWLECTWQGDHDKWGGPQWNTGLSIQTYLSDIIGSDD